MAPTPFFHSSRSRGPAGRRARALALIATLVLGTVALDVSAQAGEGRRFGGGRPAMRAMGGGPRPERAEQRASARPPKAPEQPPPMPARPPEAVIPPVAGPPQGVPGRPGRLSADERRALRQQINDANRDIYRPGRP